MRSSIHAAAAGLCGLTKPTRAPCFRVLKPEGVLVFKWNETQVKVREVLALTPHQPLFGQVSGRTGMTHWLVFMKPEAA